MYSQVPCTGRKKQQQSVNFFKIYITVFLFNFQNTAPALADKQTKKGGGKENDLLNKSISTEG